MNLLMVAFRNVIRNTRRSLMTILSISVGTAAVLIFGGFITTIVRGYETLTVQRLGHITVFHAGYFDVGGGNPGAYGISSFQSIMDQIRSDPELGPLVRVVTPTVDVSGIAGNFSANASTTFFGRGFVPSDRARMRQWNGYDLRFSEEISTRLRDDDVTTGIVGVGLARVLRLCEPLNIPNCPAAAAAAKVDGQSKDQTILDVQALASGTEGAVTPPNRPRIELLAATTGGAPNVVSLYVEGADRQNLRERDNSFVGMNLKLAQMLLFGRGEPKVTGIVVQLLRTGDTQAAKEEALRLIASRKLPLEVRDFTELEPIYLQALAMFRAIFGFVAVILAVIVVFVVANTMSMTVLERVNEIGTLRSLGIRRSGIRKQFLAEGWMLGILGASVGVALSIATAVFVNELHLTWVPPTTLRAGPLTITLTPDVTIATWIGFVLIAVVASLLPANRAARMEVVDALRHV